MFEKLKDKIFIVFGVDHYNPLGVIRTLGENGIKPIYIVLKSRNKMAVKSKYISKLIVVENIEEGYEYLLKNYGNEKKENRPFLITCDDKVMEFIDMHYDMLISKFYFFNAGKAGQITKYMNKKNILDIAEENGFNVLKSYEVENGKIPEGLIYPVITKAISPNEGAWKGDVNICYSEEELIEAFSRIKSKKILIQPFVDKENEYCIDGFSYNHGKNIFNAIASTYKYIIPGDYSPYMDIFECDNDLSKKLNILLEKIGFEGIYSIEFIIDKNGTFWFSEINFRNSTWSYAATVLQMPLPLLWALSILDGEINGNCMKSIPENFTAMNEIQDFIRRVVKGNTKLRVWKKDYKKCNCKFIKGVNDSRPFYASIRNLVISQFKKIFRRSLKNE